LIPEFFEEVRIIMTKMKVILWGLSLLIGAMVWALLMITAMFGNGQSGFIPQLGSALGMGGPVFLITGVIAGTVYFFKRNPSTAMWTWTILLLVTFVALGIGGAKQAGS
jgi:hypothetical protein